MDPVTYSIIRHRLFRVTDEAVITLKHVSGSQTTNEGHDLLVGLYRADGSLLMGGLGFLNHMVYAAEACKVIIRRFAGDINENDIFLLNDPYTAAAHTSDIYLISPIHYQGRLVAWSACFVHMTDIGALNPGGFSPNSRDIFTEGFSSPGIKLVAGGELRQDIFDTILNMVRSPEMVALDFRSMIACNNVAKERMLDLISKYGYEAVDQAGAMLIAQSEELLGSRIAELPRGCWQTRQYMEVDGKTYKVCLSMENDGKSLMLRLGGSSPQSDRAVNCTKSACLGAVLAPLFPARLLRRDLERRHHTRRESANAGRFHCELYASGSSIGSYHRCDPVNQNCRLGDHLQNACRQQKVSPRGIQQFGMRTVLQSSCLAAISTGETLSGS